MSSDHHQAAMDYIYDRQEEQEDHEVKCAVCPRLVDLYEEPIFIVGIYVDGEKVETEKWCRQCFVAPPEGVQHA